MKIEDYRGGGEEGNLHVVQVHEKKTVGSMKSPDMKLLTDRRRLSRVIEEHSLQNANCLCTEF